MVIIVNRFGSFSKASLGGLYVDDKFQCFTCEDVKRLVKVPGETRIPSGTYPITVAPWGRLHEKYKAKFPFHKGMLMLKNVPNFDGILIHMGNFNTDTEGCILVGNVCDLDKEAVFNSELAYVTLYKKVIDSAIQNALTITIKE